MVLSYGEQSLPSFPLLVAARKLGVAQSDIQVDMSRGVKLGTQTIATDSRMRTYPFFYRTVNDKPPFRVFSFVDVRQKKVSSKSFRNKVVLIGMTASQYAEPIATPIGEPMAPVMVMAHTISSLLNGDLFRTQALSYWGRNFAFVVVALYLMFVLPGMRVGTGLALSGLLLVVLLNMEFILMALESLWIPLMAPALAVPRLLARRGLKYQDIGLWEIHEAFAAQVLCTLAALNSREWLRERAGVDADLGSVPEDRINPNGGSVALGHPFGATGARILSQTVKELREKGGLALISICAAGGLGHVALLEAA
jgi:CHASE2 domain-containing sensor protein